MALSELEDRKWKGFIVPQIHCLNQNFRLQKTKFIDTTKNVYDITGTEQQCVIPCKK